MGDATFLEPDSICMVQAADEDNDKEVIYELRQQVESIWHE